MKTNWLIDSQNATQDKPISRVSIPYPQASLTRLAPHPRALRKIGSWLTIVVIGYLALGKTFAYVGYYPVFIGEVLLAASIVTLVCNALVRRVPLPTRPSALIAMALFLIAAAQVLYSIVVLSQPPLEVVRTFATIYYLLFAFITYSIVAVSRRQASLGTWILRDVIPRSVPWILIGTTVSIAASALIGTALPRIPQTDAAALIFKATDAMNGISVILFAAAWATISLPYAIWAGALGLASAASSRAALLGLALCGLFSFQLRLRTMFTALVLMVGAGIFLFAAGSVDLAYREVSVQQYADNILTIFQSQDTADADSAGVATKEWRLEFWGAIFDDSIAENRWFIGRGWGSNAALDFGFVDDAAAESNSVLRNPHNIFFSLLERGGWLIVIVWSLFYISFFVECFAAIKIRTGDTKNFVKMGTMFTLLCLISGMFDVFLESPQNAIPHWCVIGALWALTEKWPGAIASQSAFQRSK